MQHAALAVWVHDLDPFLIRFSETVGVRYYGLAYAMAFLTGAWLLFRYARAGRSPIQGDKVWDFLLVLMLGVYLGGRIGHFVLYGGLARMGEDPFALLRVWEGGMAFHGGLLGVGVATLIYARMIRVPFLTLCDLAATLAPAGLLYGRIANFINGELWGTPTKVSWAVIFPLSPYPLVPRHPSQLYEALLEGVLLLILVQWRFWKTKVFVTKPGLIIGEFCLVYGLTRCLCELFREPDATLLFGMSRGSFYSLFMLLLGAGLIVLARRSSGKRNVGDSKGA